MADYSYLPELVTEVIHWSQNGSHTPFHSATILRNGSASLAFVPHANPECVVKAIKPGRVPRGLQVEAEFELMKKLYPAKDNLYVTPQPFAFGLNPNFIVMEKLGTPYVGGSLKETEIENIGRGWGAFSADIWMRLGSVHKDICLGNYTRESDGKIGILDIASVQKVQRPEQMFHAVLLHSPNISPYVADEFERRTGISFDVLEVNSLVQNNLEMLLPNIPQSVVQDLQKEVSSKINEWKKMKESGRLNSHRPPPRRAHSSTPAPKAGT